MTPSQFPGHLAYVLCWLVGRLPLPVLHRLGDLWAVLAARRGWREAKVARRNIELLHPELDPAGRDSRVAAILRGTGRQIFETLRFWTHPARHNLRLVRSVTGDGHFAAALAAGRGLIIAAPHFGNWELLNQYLASRTPISIVYRPPDSAAGDAFVQLARRQPGVTQVRAESAGVRQLFRTLKEGGAVGILPDQQPKAGEGEFAPFFGLPALTMTLLPRLAARSGAPVLFAWAERLADGRFDIHFQPAPAAVADTDPAVATAALNVAVEGIARRDPTQYQWTYKRFSLQPPDSPLGGNPYWPDCYSARAIRNARND
ncbi:lauroyl acyltransferase [Rehaibacterium terrae]|jgi:KDO2-lipid IV(A) lauroyltransferase|uniref:KDO2-lipid IV(A) lauroyltransferase n=1 Tax=Rehaibacterium terrae TaxID=1341696 RepID=A0A7W7XZM7_9GAMM|nr:lauroyl acyltransferase [Rehaibacterium terrae]MBB5015414.1 KDO2-lipid IV(A) lauroyltransferase [Rehaibacterium terrae]